LAPMPCTPTTDVGWWPPNSGVHTSPMPTTLAALGVAVLAVLPGAVFMFAFEGRAGTYRIGRPDRTIRIIAASAALHALGAGVTYHLYRSYGITHRFEQGRVPAAAVEIAALVYVGLPYVVGWIFGILYAKEWNVSRKFGRSAYHPRAWDFIFTRQRPALIRMRLKSGDWLAGVYGSGEGDVGSYASGFGQDPDLYLNPSVRIDRVTGEFAVDEHGHPIPDGGSILLRWSEVEYAQFIHYGEDDEDVESVPKLPTSAGG
jgi:hypothetical protein